MNRCLYNSSFKDFITADENLIFGILCEGYHGEALTTTRDAWRAEISIMIFCVILTPVKLFLNMIFLALARELTWYYC